MFSPWVIPTAAEDCGYCISQFEKGLPVSSQNWKLLVLYPCCLLRNFCCLGWDLMTSYCWLLFHHVSLYRIRYPQSSAVVIGTFAEEKALPWCAKSVVKTYLSTEDWQPFDLHLRLPLQDYSLITFPPSPRCQVHFYTSNAFCQFFQSKSRVVGNVPAYC